MREGVTYFFLIDAYRSRRSPVNEARSAERKKTVSGALSNRKHGLFHIRYFEQGLLEPGYYAAEVWAKSAGGYFKNVEEQVILPLFYFRARFGAIHSASKTKK